MFLENYRKEVIKYLFSIDSFKNAWNNSWKNEIEKFFNSKKNSEENLKELGENLREIFMSTSKGTRGQGEVSAAGTAWESLLAWYLNLGLVGTRTIVIKPKKEFNFSCIQKVTSINYGSFISSSETDLVAITFPEDNKIAYTVEELNKFDKKIFSIEILKDTSNFNLAEMNYYFNKIIENNISKIRVNIIQCKTNWNDNAQIPMGWDMIYSSTGFSNKEISIGKAGFSIYKLENFKYSFITVPTQKNLDVFKETSTAVLRVKNLSGNNFWGVKTKNKVAKSISEIFNLNFNKSFNEKKFNDRIKENKYFFKELI